MTARILPGDALEVLRTLPDESVHCVVTSPPYWGLRDYGVAGQIGLEPRHDCAGWATGQDCGECYICRMRAVFAEVRRVLRSDGTAWVNMGDSYAHNTTRNPSRPDHEGKPFVPGEHVRHPVSVPSGLKPKDLCGMPWRLALALQADGWWLRSDVIWDKPNPMPSSVKDRPTTSHEYLFLLAKSARYHWDHEAAREPAAAFNAHDFTGPGYQAPGQTPHTGTRPKIQHPTALSFGRAVHEPERPGQTAAQHRSGRQPWPQGWATEGKHEAVYHSKGSTRRTVRPDETRGGEQCPGGMPLYTRNIRTVWRIPTYPYAEAHFATFPPDLASRCIKMGCPPGGTVLDPFAGSGTTGVVALKLGRHFLGVELNAEYIRLAERRMDREAGGLLVEAAG
jgi:DNA modification methylase